MTAPNTTGDSVALLVFFYLGSELALLIRMKNIDKTEDRAVRRTVEPKRQGVHRPNEEFRHLYSSPNSDRVRWAGRVACMEN